MRRGALVLLLAAALACGEPAPPAPRRVVVIGIDGAEWAVIERLRAAGRLPVLDGLIRRGTSGPLGTFRPTLSPALWTTVATGVPPAEHGVENFVLQRPVVELPLGPLPPARLKLVVEIEVAEGCDAGGLELFLDGTRLEATRAGGTLRADVPPAPRRERREGETLAVRLRRPCATAKDPRAPAEPWARLGALRVLDHEGGPVATSDRDALARADGVRAADGRLALVGRRVEQVESADRRVPALWTIASARDRRVAVVGWWCTWPAEPVHGTLVSDFLFFASTRRLLALGDLSDAALDASAVHPPAEAALLADAIPRPWQTTAEELAQFVPHDSPRFAAHLAAPARVRELGDPPLTILKDTYLQNRPHLAIARTLAARRPDLLLAYTNLVDAVEHKFWHWWEPERFPAAAPEDLADFGDTIPRAYAWTDAQIGAIVAAAGDDAVVLVLSDHGHHAAKPGGVFSGEHGDAPPGILVAAGPGVPAGATVGDATLLDVAPTVLALLGIPPAADMPGRVLDAVAPGRRDGARVPTYRDLPRPAPGPAGGALDPAVRERLRALGYLQ